MSTPQNPINRTGTRSPSRAEVVRALDVLSRAGTVRGAPGVLTEQSSAGQRIALAQLQSLQVEPAHSILALNDTDTDIDAWSICGLTDSFETDDIPVINDRALKMRAPLPEDAGNVAITSDKIPAGQFGPVFISGICLLKIKRWFDTKVLNKVDIDPDGGGSTFGVANVQGPLDLLWESDDFQGEEEHFAVVRFNRDDASLPCVNAGGVSLVYGGCCIPTGSGLAGDDYAVVIPTSDSTALTHAIVGGDINPGDKGKMAHVGTPFMGRLSVAASAGDLYGSGVLNPLWVRDNRGVHVLANLGTRAGGGGGIWGVCRVASPFRVNFIARNTVEEAAPDTVQTDSAVVFFDAQLPGERLAAVMKLDFPVTHIDAWFLANGDVSMKFSKEEAQSMSVTGTLRIIPIIGSFNEGTVTWNIIQALLDQDDFFDYIFDGTVSIANVTQTPDPDISGEVLFRIRDNNAGDPKPIFGHMGCYPLDGLESRRNPGKELIYGLYIEGDMTGGSGSGETGCFQDGSYTIVLGTNGHNQENASFIELRGNGTP